MKTYLELADEYAVEMFPNHDMIGDWNSFLNYYGSKHPEWFNQYYHKLAKRYAYECCKASLEKAAENADLADTGCNCEYFCKHERVDKQSITPR